MACPNFLGIFGSLLVLLYGDGALCTNITADDCSPAYSFMHGPFVYHVITECVGSNHFAASNCGSLNGTLATARSEVVLEIISDFLFQGIKLAMDNGGPTGEALNRKKRSGSSSSGSGSAPQNPNPQTQLDDVITAPSTSTSEPTTVTSQASLTTASPVYSSWTYWTQPYIVFPDLDLNSPTSGTCGTLRFQDNPISDTPLIGMDITNDCDDISATHSWICETVHESHRVELPPPMTKRELKTVMDYRPSAVTIGVTGILIFFTFMVSIVVMDFTRLWNAFRQNKILGRHIPKKTHKTDDTDRPASQCTLMTDISESSLQS